MSPDSTRLISLAAGVCRFSQATLSEHLPLTMDVRCEQWSHFTDGETGAEKLSYPCGEWLSS